MNKLSRKLANMYLICELLKKKIYIEKLSLTVPLTQYDKSAHKYIYSPKIQKKGEEHLTSTLRCSYCIKQKKCKIWDFYKKGTLAGK